MIAFTPGSADTRRTVSTASFWSRGSTVSTVVSPMPRRTPSMLTGRTAAPMTVRPVPGWGWWPVIAVVELSSTTRVISAWL